MPEVVKVRLRESGKIAYYHTQELYLNQGDEVVVEGESGEEWAEVVSGPEIKERHVGVLHTAIGSAVGSREHSQGSAVRQCRRQAKESLRKVKRVVTAEDRKRWEENERKAREVFKTCLQKIKDKELPMKLVDAEYSFDRSRITLYFIAEERVDFRELVKDLAHLFKTRIEMRQIGARDEAKRLGGFGPCGRPLCCATFLKEFEPVTIRMAKEQRLSLDPGKVSGVCGRLLCCLMYECQTYREMGRRLPREGTKVITEQGEGEIVDLNILKQTVTVELKEGQKVEIPVEKLKRHRPSLRRRELRDRHRHPKSNPG
ncbi:stage 0 sporulation family protein [candidate division NPL-UPA2 bacterium]|nr:stage 0 sporulation family protein [candidate division NPL-UPA2 bacterium]